MKTELTQPPLSEYDQACRAAHIDCAAIRDPSGRVWTGKRHTHCIRTIIQATGDFPRASEHGFVTMTGEFVSRQEARRKAQASGQLVSFLSPTELYSEDLY